MKTKKQTATKETFQLVANEQRELAKFDADIQVQEKQESHRSPRLEARTEMRTKETHLRYTPSYAVQYPNRTYAFARDGALHEIDHHKVNGVHNGYEFHGCPRDIESSTRLIYEPIFDVLSEKGFSEEDADYVENALEDTILHSDLSPVFNLDGISYFFQEVGDSSQGKLTPFYQAHVALNLILWGSKKQSNDLRRYFSQDRKTNDKVEKAIQEFLKKSGLQELGASFQVVRNPKVKEEREEIRNYLNDETNWEKVSRAYAEAFSDLMEPSYSMPLMNHNGEGTKGRKKGDSEQGNEFQRQRKSRAYKTGRVHEAHVKSGNAPSWIQPFEAMDLLYEGLAKKLAIEARTFTETAKMPILWYGSRQFNPASDNLGNLVFGFNEQAKLQLRKKEYSIDAQIPVKQSTMGFPEARFVLFDTSGSMKEDFTGGNKIGSTKIVPWGDRSKYHGGLVEWYGFLEWLRENHIMERTGINLVNFSSSTILGEGLEEAKRVALSPQFGNTSLNLDGVGKMFHGKGSLIMTLSDGGIENWASIKKEFVRRAQEHYYFHLQLGQEVPMCKDLRKAGLHVEIIKTPEELRGRTIKLADKFYRRAA